jgi:uncharacterized spore protein YtfJ
MQEARMDTLRLRETLQAELEKLARTRDELRVQAALGKAETRSELNRLESVWQRVQDELRRLGEQAIAPAAEIGGAARSLVEELAQGYGRVRRDLEDAGLNARTQRSLSALKERDQANLQGPLGDAEKAASDTPALRAIDRLASHIGGRADARAIFAPPVTKDGITVIPVGRVFGGFGFGAGASSALADPSAGEGGSAGQGMGGGGGFSAQPVGFIEIDRNGARFRRIETTADTWFDVASVGLDLLRRAGALAITIYKKARKS